MKTLYIIANWKANMLSADVHEWCNQLKESRQDMSTDGQKNVIVCPSFPYLPLFKEVAVKNVLPLSIGAQDIAPFSMGAYTGEVVGKQIKEFATYVLIGHSERRTQFGETDAMIAQKVIQAHNVGLTPIVCVQDSTTPIPGGVNIVAYEPISAIGTGNPDTPENANNVAKEILASKKVTSVLYGGSVTKDNVASFTSLEYISGILVGSASLDPIHFSQIITHA